MATIHELISRMNAAKVEYVLIGGMAAIVHGSPRFTEDIDVCISITQENFQRIIDAFRGTNPKFRMRPDRPRFFEDVEKLRGFKNLNLVTDLGQIDLLGEVSGIGGYADALARSVVIEFLGQPTRVLDLDSLLAAKRAAGRPKDLPSIAELEKIRRRREARAAEGKKDMP